jgi:D-amino-acid dehydrogenase
MVGMGLRMMLNPESPFAMRPRLSRELLEWGLLFIKASTHERVAKAAPLLRDLNLQSRACYEHLSEEFGNSFGLEKRGLLMLTRTKEALEAEAHLAEEAKRLGLRAEVLDTEGVARLDPHITMSVAGGVWFAEDCHLIPQRFVQGLTQALIERGVRFCWETEVKGWKTSAGTIDGVETTQGTYQADEYVVAGGAWSPQIMSPLGVRLPLQAGKGYSFNVPTPRQLPAICAILTEARLAVTPMGGSLRFAGTMEITGTDLSINEARVNGIRKSIPHYYPAFQPEDFKGLPVWSGLRPCSPDGLPYVGRFSKFKNLSSATGHAMMGLSLAPITGKLMATLLSDEKPDLDLTLLQPDRY